MDRLKHIFKLSRGEYVAPEKIERIYSQSPLINQIFVDGSSLCSYPVALVVPNGKSLTKTLNSLGRKSSDVRALQSASLLTENQVVTSNNENSEKLYLNERFVTIAELCTDPVAEQLILNEIIQLGENAGLNSFEQVNGIFSPNLLQIHMQYAMQTGFPCISNCAILEGNSK